MRCRSSASVSFIPLHRDKQPREYADQAKTGAYSQSDRTRVGRIYDGGRAHASEKRGEDGQRAVVARFDQLGCKKARIAKQLDPCRRQDDGGAKLTVEASGYDPLQTQSGTCEAQRRHSLGILPRGFGSILCYARFSAEVGAQRRRQGHQPHHRRRRHEPPALLHPDMVTYPAERYTDEKRKERCECLLIAFVEGVIRCGEQACDGETELDEASALKTTPDIAGEEGRGGSETGQEAVQDELPEGRIGVDVASEEAYWVASTLL